MCIIVQICANNRYFLVCLEVCYQPTLVACIVIILCGTRAIWSIFTARRYATQYMPSSYICPSVSVCMSVTLWYCVKMAKRRITQIMPYDTDILLLQNFY